MSKAWSPLQKIKREIDIVMLQTVVAMIGCLFIAKLSWWVGVVALGGFELITLLCLKLSTEIYMTDVTKKGDREDEER